jgi:hypothetical protein
MIVKIYPYSLTKECFSVQYTFYLNFSDNEEMAERSYFSV